MLLMLHHPLLDICESDTVPFFLLGFSIVRLTVYYFFLFIVLTITIYAKKYNHLLQRNIPHQIGLLVRAKNECVKL